jgi:hypothetical protein
MDYFIDSFSKGDTTTEPEDVNELVRKENIKKRFFDFIGNFRMKVILKNY